MENKGFTIEWKGISGLTWPRLHPVINKMRRKAPDPVIMVIHCGGNSIGGKLNLKKLQTNMKGTLANLHRSMPNTLIVWSEIIPRLYWRNMISTIAAEKCRKRVNSSLSEFVFSELNGAYIKYPDITSESKMFTDGVHLTPLGNSIFTHSIQAALVAFKSSNGRKYPH